MNQLHWGSSGLWKQCLKDLSEVCRWWWSDWSKVGTLGDDLPNDNDIDDLWNSLHSAMDEAVREVQFKSKPSQSSQQPHVENEEESAWNLLSTDPMDAEDEIRHEDDASSQSPDPPTSDTSMFTEPAAEDSAQDTMLAETDLGDPTNQDAAPDKYFAFVTPDDQEQVETLRRCLTYRPEGVDSTFLV